MLYASSATLRFEAAHIVIGHPDCGKPHGHTWSVTAHVSHEDLHEGYPRGGAGLGGCLEALVREVDGRDLKMMVPLIVATPTALAAWFFERISHDFPRLTRVDVCHRLEGGSVSRA